MSDRYLITASLLSAWKWFIEVDEPDVGEWTDTLKRISRPPSEAAQDGIHFEADVVAMIQGRPVGFSKWFDCAIEVAAELKDAALNYRASRELALADGKRFLVYGRLDALRGETIYDIKYSHGYEQGKYQGSPQHPTYLYCLPETEQFVYLVSDGNNVYHEQYRREETPPLESIVSDFDLWLGTFPEYRALYLEHWKALG